MMSSAWESASQEICASALASLEWFYPPRLAKLLDDRSPRDGVLTLLDRRRDAEMFALLRPRDDSDFVARWRRALQHLSPAAIEDRIHAAGVTVWLRDNPDYPAVLAERRDPPAVLFVQGDAALVHQERRVAIVGTRRCTAYGRGIAEQLGADLSAAGVKVVSGLAVGIDGAAHEGVLRAGGQPIGVVGSGLDLVYPRRHRALWQQVSTEGVLLSEAPLGARPETWRFPSRNRIIAGLAEIVVVVESALKGGSQSTVNAAMDRNIDVMAVPGPVGAPTSAGTNQLLVDGAPPVLGAQQVLDWMGLSGNSARQETLFPDSCSLSADAMAVIDSLNFAPTSTERLLSDVGLSPGRLTVALNELAAAGQAAGGAGWWARVP